MIQSNSRMILKSLLTSTSTTTKNLFLKPSIRTFVQSSFTLEGVEVSKGIVKFFDTRKGFGFIIPEDESGDVFVHQTAIHAKGFRSLAEGEPVEYELQNDPRTGKQVAHNVTGPNGDFVQGAPKPRHDDDHDNY